MEEVKKDTAQEVPVQEQQEEVNIVCIKLCGKTYYLVDLDFSLSLNIRDSMLFKSDENSYKLASAVEKHYRNAIGKVLKMKLNQVML